MLPREPGDRAEAAKLTRILPAILKKNQFKRTYSSAWWYKLKSGCAVYGVFWDAGKLNGLGDVSIRRMDLLNLFWEPGVTDIQDSANFFSTELVSHEVLEEQYPQLKGKLGGGGFTVSRFLYDDQVDTSDKALVVDWYYHIREKGRRVLQYCKFVGETVLYATENDPELREQVMDDGTGVCYRVPEFDLEVSAQDENPYKTMEYNQLALQLFQMGFFREDMADQALRCLELMDFKNKDQLAAAILQGKQQAAMAQTAEGAASGGGMAVKQTAMERMRQQTHEAVRPR